MKNKKLYKCIQAAIIIIVSFLLILINYIYFRPRYNLYDKQLRYVDHFISGVASAQLLYLLTNDVKLSAFAYSFASLGWELYQYFMRGYFQIGQYIFDLLGVALFLFIHRKNSISMKDT